jgi:hypothetical protein
MKQVIMDTNYWISLTDCPDRLLEFDEAVADDDVKVILSFGNFIDLVRADDASLLAEIIAGECDYCLPLFDEGDSYPVSGNPVDLVPSEPERSIFESELRGESPSTKIQYLIRAGNWDAPDEYYDGIEQYKELYDEYGHDNLKGHTFREYLEEKDGEYVLDPEDVDKVSYVKSEVILHRLRLFQPEENPDPHDVADLQLCIQAILSDCNMLLMEKKWVNENLIGSVLDSLDSDKELTVYKDFDEFISDLNDG